MVFRRTASKFVRLQEAVCAAIAAAVPLVAKDESLHQLARVPPLWRSTDAGERCMPSVVLVARRG